MVRGADVAVESGPELPKPRREGVAAEVDRRVVAAGRRGGREQLEGAGLGAGEEPVPVADALAEEEEALVGREGVPRLPTRAVVRPVFVVAGRLLFRRRPFRGGGLPLGGGLLFGRCGRGRGCLRRRKLPLEPDLGDGPGVVQKQAVNKWNYIL